MKWRISVAVFLALLLSCFSVSAGCDTCPDGKIYNLRTPDGCEDCFQIRVFREKQLTYWAGQNQDGIYVYYDALYQRWCRDAWTYTRQGGRRYIHATFLDGTETTVEILGDDDVCKVIRCENCWLFGFRCETFFEYVPL
ncbi:MAG: hypothetical protein ACOC6Q_02055 [Patescibacteria group bacterium]